jgi:hypothetical protein
MPIASMPSTTRTPISATRPHASSGVPSPGRRVPRTIAIAAVTSSGTATIPRTIAPFSWTSVVVEWLTCAPCGPTSESVELYQGATRAATTNAPLQSAAQARATRPTKTAGPPSNAATADCLAARFRVVDCPVLSYRGSSIGACRIQLRTDWRRCRPARSWACGWP